MPCDVRLSFQSILPDELKKASSGRGENCFIMLYNAVSPLQETEVLMNSDNFHFCTDLDYNEAILANQ